MQHLLTPEVLLRMRPQAGLPGLSYLQVTKKRGHGARRDFYRWVLRIPTKHSMKLLLFCRTHPVSDLPGRNEYGIFKHQLYCTPLSIVHAWPRLLAVLPELLEFYGERGGWGHVRQCHPILDRHFKGEQLRLVLAR